VVFGSMLANALRQLTPLKSGHPAPFESSPRIAEGDPVVAMKKHCKNNFNELFQNITLNVMNIKPLHNRTL